MTRHRLTDEEIAETLIRSGGRPEAGGEGPPDPASGAGGRGACAHEDRLWDMACGVLDPRQTERILDHTLDCPDCSLALRVAHETFAASGLSPEPRQSTSPLVRMWNRLTGTILRPAPALAYLVLLFLSYPLYRVLTPTTTGPGVAPSGGSVAPAPAPSGGAGHPAGDPIRSGSPSDGGPSAAGGQAGLRSLQVLRLTGDLSLRNGETLPPVRVRLGETEALVLRLFPDAEDLPKERGATLLVRVLEGENVVASTTRRMGDLEEDRSLSLLLDGARLHPGTIYRVEVTTTLPAGGSAGVPPTVNPRPEAPPPTPILKQSFRVD